MAYRISEAESVRRAVRRIAREQIDDALESLAVPAKDRAKGVHSARKCFKKLRALVRFVRHGMDRDAFRDADLKFRDAGRRLAPARDAEVLVQTLDALTSHFADQLKASAFDTVRKALLSDKRKALGELRADDTTMAEVISDLAATRDAVEQWKLKGDGRDLASDGIRRSYREARARFKQKGKKPDDRTLHEWRKATKTLAYHLRILEPTWKPGLRGLRREIDGLADRLGAHHDLAVLRAAVSELAASGAQEEEVQAAIGLVDRRRKELSDEAHRLGALIYAERPKAFARRFKAYLGVWGETEARKPDAAAE